MNRLEIIVVNNPADTITRYVDVPSVISFLARVNRSNIFSIYAHKGERSIFIEKLDPATLLKRLNDFANQP